jgi:hypothetical protein
LTEAQHAGRGGREDEGMIDDGGAIGDLCTDQVSGVCRLDLDTTTYPPACEAISALLT